MNALGEIAGIIWAGFIGMGFGLLFLGLVGLAINWAYRKELSDWKEPDA